MSMPTVMPASVEPAPAAACRPNTQQGLAPAAHAIQGTGLSRGMPGQAPEIELRNICKYYGPLKANHNISLKIKPGCIKALLGENGAGKSTLMAILAGQIQPDSGQILINGKPVELSSPSAAFAAGIGMVYQHFMLIDNMSVTNNVLLGQHRSLRLNKPARRRFVQELGETYGLPVDPRVRITHLSMGERQRVEILKLLARKSRVLILDEPTAVLTPNETEQLFAALKRMAAEGRSIVFISHKLHEVIRLADEIAILRKGEIVDEFTRTEVPDEEELARRMFGRNLDRNLERSLLGVAEANNAASIDAAQDMAQSEKLENLTKPSRKKEPRHYEHILHLENASCENAHNISFTLYEGQTLALLGVAGNGQKELVEMVCGLRRPTSGRIEILNKDWQKFFVKQRTRTLYKAGLVYIPEDRRGLAACGELNLIDNFLLTTRMLFSRRGFLDLPKARQATADAIKAYNVEPGIAKASARSLSGGNLQKLIIARELYRNPRCIVAENPTQGLDVAATTEVWQRLETAKKNAGILLVTGDLNEALHLADHIGILYRGRLVDIFPRSNAQKVEQIGLMMAGGARAIYD